MDSNPLTSLTMDVLQQLQNTLQLPVSRELNAFCYLCPAASLALPNSLRSIKMNFFT